MSDAFHFAVSATDGSARRGLITMPRGLFGRKVTGAATGDLSSRVASAAASGLADAFEERALWSRYGL